MAKSKSKFALSQLINLIQDENTTIAEEGISSAEFSSFIDTGSYILNAQLSGSLYGGFPNTKILGLAGEEAVGKTFFALGICREFLAKDPDAFVVWYLAEPAVTKKMLIERDIDPSRVVFAEPLTIEDFRHHAIKTLDAYTEMKDKPPMMIVLDSLSALSSNKELEDSTSGSDKRDMTKAPLIKGTFRIIDKKLAKAKVPMIMTSHVYAVIGAYVPMKELSGGLGPKYAGDIIAVLSKKKDKEGSGTDTEVVGNLIKIKMFKNRIAKQNTEVTVSLRYDTGLNRHYGLIELGEKYDILKKMPGKIIKYEFPDGQSGTPKTIYKSPEKYFTKETMELLEEVAHNEFEYGKGTLNDNNEDDTEAAVTQ